MKKISYIIFSFLCLLTFNCFVQASTSCVYTTMYTKSKVNGTLEEQQKSNYYLVMSIDNNKVSFSDRRGQKNTAIAIPRNWNKESDGFASITNCPNYIMCKGKCGITTYGSETYDASFINKYDEILKKIDATICSYPNFDMIIDDEVRQLSAIGKHDYVDAFGTGVVYDQFSFDDKFQEWWFETIGKTCENVEVFQCDNKTTYDTSRDYTIYTDAYLSALDKTGSGITNCETKIIGEDKNVQVPGCWYYTREMKNLKDIYLNYSDETCDMNCKLNKMDEIKKKQNELLTTCNSIFQGLDYTDDCVKSCLNLREEIKEEEDKYFKDSDAPLPECGFSKNLSAWIANIVKWLKYIIPVVVIVLGILDFIKAIASDKDDGIKKAQSKFIRRLIAAALIFLVPFILKFILDKMGFGEYISGCGIIKEL